MPVMDKLLAAAAIALPLCYVCSKQSSALLQHALVACLWVVYLGIPCVEETPIRTFSTMITAVLSFIVPLKLSQLVLCPPLTTTKKGDSAEDTTSDISKNGALSLRDFLSFTGSFLYYAVPISGAKGAGPPNWPILLTQNATSLAVVMAKIAIIPLLELALHQLADKHPYPSLTQDTVPYMQMVVTFTMEVIALSWSTDVQSVAVSLLSGGRFEMLYMHNYPFLSRSLQDLWGRRYNLLINSLLKETVYIPAQTHFGYSKQVASLAAFFTSGVLHSWVAHFTFGGGVARALLFFVLQALWMNGVERQTWYRESVPSIAKAILTICYFYATAWLYVGLFVEAMPDWLNKNSQTVPDFPIVRNVTSSLASLLGLVQDV